MAGVSGCVSLSGSSLCPRFSGSYINPSNLSTAWPWFSGVTDLESFDTEFARYLSSTGTFARTKQLRQLECSNYQAGFVLQYQQTFLCGEFTGIDYSSGCNAAVVNRPMTCQSTCYQFADSELDLVNNTFLCPLLSSTVREATLTKDFTDCTDWTTLTTNNTATCVEGSTNEANCGFGSSSSQLCNYCDPTLGDKVSPCCILPNTNLASCGYNITSTNIATTPAAGPTSPPSQPTRSSRSSSAVSSSTLSSSLSSSVLSTSDLSSSPTAPLDSAITTGTSSAAPSASHSRLSTGGIVGVVLGSVIGFLLLLLLLLFLLCRRRRRREGVNFGNEKGGSTTLFSGEWSPASRSLGGTGFGGDEKEKELIGGLGLTAGAIGAGATGAAVFSGNTPRSSTSSATPTTADEPSSRRLLPFVADAYSSALILPSSHVIALYPYPAELEDELTLVPGDVIQVEKLYDDGWAHGREILDDDDEGTGGRSGAFPLVCVGAAGSGSTASESDGEDMRSNGTRPNTPARQLESSGGGARRRGGGEGYESTSGRSGASFVTAE